MISTHPFSSCLQDYQMKSRAVVGIPLGLDNVIPINYDATDVCEIHLTLSCGFNRQSTSKVLYMFPPSVCDVRASIVVIVILLHWLAVEQPVLLGPSPYTRDNPVVTAHTYFWEGHGPRGFLFTPRPSLSPTSPASSRTSSSTLS